MCKKNSLIFAAALSLLSILAATSILVGKYPLSISGLIAGDTLSVQVFLHLRLGRTLVAIFGGFLLGLCGYVFQTLFQNPLASPDMIGVSSGASAGAAVGILFLGNRLVTLSSFAGAMLSVLLVLGIASVSKSRKTANVVICGIAVHSLSQTSLMMLKQLADPSQQLAAIEYWMMGSLSGVSLRNVTFNLALMSIVILFLVLFFRTVQLLSLEENEARALGIPVSFLRWMILLVTSFGVASVISVTGLISFLSLIAPHIAHHFLPEKKLPSFLLSGIVGSVLLCGADILSRCVGSAELPVSIFTSLLGCPFLIRLLMKRRQAE